MPDRWPAYDSDTGLLESEMLDADGDATMHLELSYERDGFGNVTKTTADDKIGAPRVSSTTYEPSGVFPIEHTNALGHVVVLELRSRPGGAALAGG